MWAAHGRRDDFEEDIEMDSAGDRFGARRGAPRGAAFSASRIFVKLLHGLRLQEQKYCKVCRFEKVGIPTVVEVLFI